MLMIPDQKELGRPANSSGPQWFTTTCDENFNQKEKNSTCQEAFTGDGTNGFDLSSVYNFCSAASGRQAVTKNTPVTLTLLLPAFVAVLRQFILGFVTCIMQGTCEVGRRIRIVKQFYNFDCVEHLSVIFSGII
ncbi:hypothetical protein POM88_044992 [Heracleum sosnowskyi]|uniref:Uncharacterized protein n=1 Tax=Heracleum sosnowskyi TaxID=360622 RepID=A0AAD8H5K6_9APIA|nr:hypothetical protein POM88_044992 [Heracleum sosnowskyi]